MVDLAWSSFLELCFGSGSCPRVFAPNDSLAPELDEHSVKNIHALSLPLRPQGPPCGTRQRALSQASPPISPYPPAGSAPRAMFRNFCLSSSEHASSLMSQLGFRIIAAIAPTVSPRIATRSDIQHKEEDTEPNGMIIERSSRRCRLCYASLLVPCSVMLSVCVFFFCCGDVGCSFCHPSSMLFPL